MDNTLIDRETLGQFVDELIKKKPLPTENPEEINTLREKSITALDDKIGTAIFSQFTQEQNIEFNRMLNLEEEPSEDIPISPIRPLSPLIPPLLFCPPAASLMPS